MAPLAAAAASPSSAALSSTAKLSSIDSAGVPPPLEHPVSPTTLTVTSIRLALRHQLVKIAPSECPKTISPSSDG